MYCQHVALLVSEISCCSLSVMLYLFSIPHVLKEKVPRASFPSLWAAPFHAELAAGQFSGSPSCPPPPFFYFLVMVTLLFRRRCPSAGLLGAVRWRKSGGISLRALFTRDPLETAVEKIPRRARENGKNLQLLKIQRMGNKSALPCELYIVTSKYFGRSFPGLFLGPDETQFGCSVY